MCSCASFSCSLSFLLDGKKVYKFEQDRRCDQCHLENKIESQEHLNIFLQAEEKCLLTSYILSYLFSWICMNLKQIPFLAFAGLYLNKVYAL